MLAVPLVLLFLLAPSLSAPQNSADIASEHPVSEDGEVQALVEYLGGLVERGDTPLVWVQDDPGVEGERLSKRARYYRRYPWKRQNERNYDPDGYLCAPSREDVFQLLMALHDARNGNSDRSVTFCNRKRPARAVFTNIRFLGKR